jgi:hypothetical protein
VFDSGSEARYLVRQQPASLVGTPQYAQNLCRRCHMVVDAPVLVHIDGDELLERHNDISKRGSRALEHPLLNRLLLAVHIQDLGVRAWGHSSIHCLIVSLWLFTFRIWVSGLGGTRASTA